MSKTDGVSFAILFGVLFLLAPPLLTESKIFDTKQLTRQIKLEVKVAQVTKHPLLTRGALDYLSEKIRRVPEDTSTGIPCGDVAAITEEDELAKIAAEVVSASNIEIKNLKEKYYCYRFDILSYFIAKHQNTYLQYALDNGFDAPFIYLPDSQFSDILYLFNQAVFAENKEALALLPNNGAQHLYSVLENFISKTDDILVNKEQEIGIRSFKYKRRDANSDDVVFAVLHNNKYDLETARDYIPKKLRQAEYLKALNTLIDTRRKSNEY